MIVDFRKQLDGLNAIHYLFYATVRKEIDGISYGFQSASGYSWMGSTWSTLEKSNCATRLCNLLVSISKHSPEENFFESDEGRNMVAILDYAKQHHISLGIDNEKLKKMLDPENRYLSNTTTQLTPEIYTAMINTRMKAAGHELRSVQKNLELHFNAE